MPSSLADITSHDTYVDGVPRDAFRELRRQRPRSLDRRGRRRTRLLEPDEVRRRSSRQPLDRHLLESLRHSARRHGRRRDRSASHHDGDGLPGAHQAAPPGQSSLRPQVRRRVRRRRSRTGGRDTRLTRHVERSSTSSARSRANFPCGCLGRVLGLPDEDLEWLVGRGDALIGNSDPDFTDFVVDQVDTSEYRLLPFRSPVAIELFEYAAHALEERRLTPTHDVLSALARAQRRRRVSRRSGPQELLHVDGGGGKRHHALHHDRRAARAN